MRPHFEYAAAISSPHLKKDQIMLECVQKFGLRMATRAWNDSYQQSTQLPSLQERRVIARLQCVHVCLLYKMIYNLCYFEKDMITVNTTRSHRVPHDLIINPSVIPTLLNSFIAFTVSLWN